MVPAGKEPRKFDNTVMPGSQPTVQQQPNFSDCGIYLLQYIESFFRDPIADYNFPIKSIKQWFTKEEVEGKRGYIAELIRKLATAQNPGKELSFPALNFLNPENEGEDSEEEEEEDDEPIPLPQVATGEGEVVGGTLVSQVRLTASTSSSVGPGRLLVTPAKQQGKVLIQKTGTFNQTQLKALNAVPPGVTVTPARTLASNISLNPVTSSKPGSSGTGVGVSLASSTSSVPPITLGDSIQTSPDSTSHEDSYSEGGGGSERQGEGEAGQGVQPGGDTIAIQPDSQGFESGKRAAEQGGPEGGAKRTKSEEES